MMRKKDENLYNAHMSNGTERTEPTEKTLSIRESKEMLYVLPDNAQEIGYRSEQQDYFSYSDLMDFDEIAELGCVAVLGDGMGGMENGRNASITGVKTFLDVYSDNMHNGVSLPDAMLDALYAANDAVLNDSGSGSTLIGAVVKKNKLNWISVGDSHLYLYRNGLLRQLNKDHIYAELLDDMCAAGEISREEALNNPERGALTSYLGVPEIELIDINEQPVPLRMGDIVVLCTDGLYRALSNEEISNILSSDTEEKAQALVDAAMLKQYEGQDNTTVVLLKII